MPSTFRANLMLWTFAMTKVPMIAWVRARVVELNDQRCVIRIPLRRRTRNHLRSMYVGALAVGADVAGGLMAFDRIRRSGQPISLIFKDLHAEFHRRPESDVVFTCEDGEAIGAMVEQAVRTGERVHHTVRILATTAESGPDPVCSFALTLSIKRSARS